MWGKFLDLGRIFKTYAFYIKLIKQTLKDIVPFVAIFIVFLFMFGSSFYILSTNREEHEKLVEIVHDNWLADTFVN